MVKNSVRCSISMTMYIMECPLKQFLGTFRQALLRFVPQARSVFNPMLISTEATRFRVSLDPFAKKEVSVTYVTQTNILQAASLRTGKYL